MEIFEPLKRRDTRKMITFSGCEDKMRRHLSAYQEMGYNGELSQPAPWPWMIWNKFLCLSHPVYGICCCCLVAKSCLTLATLWTVTPRLLCPMGFLGQKYCNGLPFSPLGDLPNPGIEPESPALQADSLSRSHLGSLSLPLPLIY